MAKLTPDDLASLLSILQTAGLDSVVVGGQAVNFWAYQYHQTSEEWSQLLPFASEDLDFFGGKMEAIACAEALQSNAIRTQVSLNTDFEPTPNAGVVLAQYRGQTLRIDFLASVFGLNDAEIGGTAIIFQGKGSLQGLSLKVLNPILCLEGKLKCLRGLPQGSRQDLKHVKISLLCVREFLKEQCQADAPRSGLKLIERVTNSTITEDGLSAWYRHQVQIESAIPTDQLQGFTSEPWQRFHLIRWPQLLEQLKNRRQRYQQIMERLQQVQSPEN
jgi:hypothetical protein